MFTKHRQYKNFHCLMHFHIQFGINLSSQMRDFASWFESIYNKLFGFLRIRHFASNIWSQPKASWIWYLSERVRGRHRWNENFISKFQRAFLHQLRKNHKKTEHSHTKTTITRLSSIFLWLCSHRVIQLKDYYFLQVSFIIHFLARRANMLLFENLIQQPTNQPSNQQS